MEHFFQSGLRDRKMKFFAYILCSQKTNGYYVSSTQNLLDRVESHNKNRVKSTKHGVPWDLVYSEEFDTRSAAFKREHEIKNKKSRKYIETLIYKRA
jgi:putative endonuclease